MAPTTDRGAMQQIIRALLAEGWKLHSVYDGEEDIPVTGEKEAIDVVESMDMAHVHFVKGDPALDSSLLVRGWIFFVLGNEPDEVACDYTTNLDPTVENLTRSWW
jgi:hypothetical protein